ncbi:TPA: hypothetical protein EYP27_05660 [Candidatus Bathyarchaeota archaeon]|nr:hypothetical protein [Candidatus Bathyarchaeota archaeon]
MKAETLESSEALMQEIESLSVKIVELREQRNKLNLEAKTWLRKGEVLVDKARQLKKELRSLREEVGQLRAEIKELKAGLEKVREKMVEKRKVRDGLKEKLRELKAKISIPRGKAERLFEELEWHIQTNPLSPEEERKLVERVKTLEGQLNIHGRIGTLVEQLNSNFQELQALREEAEKVRDQLDETYSKLKEKLAAIDEKAEGLEEAERQAGEAYQKFTDAKVQADRLHSRIVEALNKQRTLKTDLKEIRRGKEAEALEGVVKELEEAYKQGKKKKLTLEEFKLLMSRGLI